MANQQDDYPLRTLSLRSASSQSADVPHTDTAAHGGECEAFLAAGVADTTTLQRSPVKAKAPLQTGQHVTPSVPSAGLHRSSYVIYLVLLYAALAVFAWVVTCVQTYRPLTVGHYGVDVGDSGYTQALYTRNEQYFRASRVIQAIVGVVTIPLTSAVCSKAAVAFIQRRKQSLGFSMRQLMVLADKGWTDPNVLGRVMFAGWKRYGSSFLLAAILLNLLGATISPLQQIFLSTKTIQTPTGSTTVTQLTDILDQFPDSDDGGISDTNLITILTRNALTSTYNTDPQARLWVGNYSCSMLNYTEALPEQCVVGSATLGNLSQLTNPYLAQLPSGYNTGLIQQFLPRFNFSVERENVTATSMPAACGRTLGSFYVKYANSSSDGYGNIANWSLTACMPADQRTSPWKAVRTRQDFSETLYLDLSTNGYEMISDIPDELPNGAVFKITVSTTAGFFELPNYMNGQVAGPLLDGDPIDSCGIHCEAQGYENGSIYDHNLTGRDAPASSDNQTTSSLSLERVVNKGPLLTIAMALFGDDSFIPNRLNNPSAYMYNLTAGDPDNYMCIDQAPFMGLLRGDTGQNNVDNDLDFCTTKSAETELDIDIQIASYITAFYYNDWYGLADERISNAFASAAFLATEVWLSHGIYEHTLTVSSDMGANTEIPTMSKAGMILISALLALDLLCLLAMAIYSSTIPRWTTQLDSFAMMRIGANMHELVPLNVTHDPSKIAALDETPGYVGDATAGEGAIGELGIGACAPLTTRRRYRSYAEGVEILDNNPRAGSQKAAGWESWLSGLR